MKKTFSLVVRCVMSLILAFLFALSWFWYMLAVSDVPPSFTKEDVTIIFLLFTAILIVSIMQVLMVKKCKICGSYLLLTVGFISLLVWIITYFAWNFSIGDVITNLYVGKIIVTGIILSSLSSGSQVLQILVFYKRKRENVQK